MKINKNIGIKGDFWGLFLGIVLCVIFAACDSSEKGTVAPLSSPSFNTDAVSDQSYIQGRTITPLQLPRASSGNEPLTYSLSPLPAGIEFDTSTQMLTGTPSAALSSTELTYMVQDADGDTDTIMFSVEVAADLPLSFTRGIADRSYIQGRTITPLRLPRAIGGIAPLTYSLSPVPSGFEFNSSTRILTGMPSAALSSTELTYTVQDADGDTDTRTFSVEVVENLVPSFNTGAVSDQSYTQGMTIAPLQLPQASGGNAPLTYSLSPVPAGLDFNSSTQMLTGRSSVALSSTELTYTVQDADGDTDTTTFFVEVAANPLPFFTKEVADQVYIQGIQRVPVILPEARSGNGELTYSLEPLPNGLTFDSGTRELSGSPTVLGSTGVTYTVSDADMETDELMFNIVYREPQDKNICGRTPQVRDAIIALIEGAPACEAVNELQLADITALRLDAKGIAFLQADDFEGLLNLRDLQLWSNRLTIFPEGVFDGLTSLQTLDLGRNFYLRTLPEDVFDGLTRFDGLTSLQTLDLSHNFLETLPEDVFDGLTSLQTLDLSRNNLQALPENVFEGLSNLAELDMSYNVITNLPAGLFDGLTSLTDLDLRDNALDATPAICSAGVSCILLFNNIGGEG